MEGEHGLENSLGLPPRHGMDSNLPSLKANGGSSVPLLRRGAVTLKRKMTESCSDIGDAGTPEILEREHPVLQSTLQVLHVTSGGPIPHWTVWDKCSWEDTAEKSWKIPKRSSFKYLNESMVPFISVWAGRGGGGMYTRWGFDPEVAARRSYFEQWLTVVKLQEIC